MLVIATFMFDPAKLAMNWVSASGINIWRGETAEVSDVVVVTRAP
jgi:hypothetical protein